MCYCNITITQGDDFVGTFKINRNRVSEIPSEDLSRDSLKSDNEKLMEENKKLKYKLETIDDYYQMEIQQLVERLEKEKLEEIQKLKNEIDDLKSRALVNPRKVTNEQVKKIKELRASGLSYRAIVKETGLSTCTIQRALKGIYD